jgi:hypothetical protein
MSDSQLGPARRVDREMGGGHPWSLVTANLEALLTALYVLIDDHVIPSGVAAELLAHAGRTGALRAGLILIGDKASPAGTSKTWSPPGSR